MAFNWQSFQFRPHFARIGASPGLISFTPSVSAGASGATFNLLLENGDALLQESGDNILVDNGYILLETGDVLLQENGDKLVY